MCQNRCSPSVARPFAPLAFCWTHLALAGWIVAAPILAGGCGLAIPQDLTEVVGPGQLDPGGTDANTSLPPAVRGPNDIALQGSLGAAAAMAQSGLKVVCSTVQAPPSVATASLDGAGNFALLVAGAKAQLLGCSLMNQGDVLLANFTFQGGGKGLEGNDRMAHDVALTADANFGRVYWDDTTFEVAVNADNIAQARAALASQSDQVMDMGRTFAVQPTDFALPKGTLGACAANATAADCPSALREAGTWSLATMDGTRPRDKSYVAALQAWSDDTQASICGLSLGLSPNALKDADLDFTAAGRYGDTFSYSTALSWKNALQGNGETTSFVDNGYQLVDAARTLQDVMSCQPTSVTTSQLGKVEGYACGPDSGNRFRFSGAVGCTNATTGAPSGVVPTLADWSRARSANLCDDSAAGAGLTLSKCTVTPTANKTPLRCTAVTGDFRNNGQPSPQAYNPDSSLRLARQGERCSSINDPGPQNALAQRSCYATYLAASKADQENSGCLPQVRVNAADANAASQLFRDFRPTYLRHADLFQALPDGKQGTLSSRSRAQLTAWAPDPSFGQVPLGCEVVTTRSLSLVRLSETRLLAVVTEQSGTDDLRPACLASFATGARRTLAYLERN